MSPRLRWSVTIVLFVGALTLRQDFNGWTADADARRARGFQQRGLFVPQLQARLAAVSASPVSRRHRLALERLLQDRASRVDWRTHEKSLDPVSRISVAREIARQGQAKRASALLIPVGRISAGTVVGLPYQVVASAGRVVLDSPSCEAARLILPELFSREGARRSSRVALASCLVEFGDPESALRWLEPLGVQPTGSPWLTTIRAHAHARAGRPRLARQLLESVVSEPGAPAMAKQLYRGLEKSAR